MSETEVGSLLAGVAARLGWADQAVTVVVVGGGVVAGVGESLLTAQCVSRVLSLPGSDWTATSQYQTLLPLYQTEEVGRVVLLTQSAAQLTGLLSSLAGDLGWEVLSRTNHLAWPYLHTEDQLADLAEAAAGARLHVVAEEEVEGREVGAGRELGRLVQAVQAGLDQFSLQHCADSQPVSACVADYRTSLHRSPRPAPGPGYNVLELNTLLDTPDSPLYRLAGQHSGGRLAWYSGLPEPWTHPSSHSDTARLCVNSSREEAALAALPRPTANLETLWGSIALGISIFGCLIVSISALYLVLAVGRKQKSEFGSGKDRARLLHYWLVLALMALFLAPVPFLLPVGGVVCAARSVGPALALAALLSCLLVSMVASLRQTVYTVTPTHRYTQVHSNSVL